MKKVIVLLVAGFLTACSSSDATHYYQVTNPDVTASGKQFVAGHIARQLWVEPVTVSDYLAGNGIVYQNSEVRFTLATQNLWASPLDQQLQQTLISQLNTLLPDWLVTSTQPQGQHDTLTVTITGFNGRSDGHALISGYWLYQHEQQVIRRSFHRVLPQSEDGYSALVKTLSAGWFQQVQQIARALAENE